MFAEECTRLMRLEEQLLRLHSRFWCAHDVAYYNIVMCVAIKCVTDYV